MRTLAPLLILGLSLAGLGCKAKETPSPAPNATPSPAVARVQTTQAARPASASQPKENPSPAAETTPKTIRKDPGQDDAAGANGKGTRNVATASTPAPQLL